MKSLFSRYINTYAGLSKESWMLSIVMLINRSGAMVLPFMGIYMKEKLGYDLKAVGLALSFYGIGSIFGSWFGGWLCDKIGSFKTQVASLLACIPLYLLLPNFVSLAAICTMLFVLSFCYETFRPANSVAITSYAKKENITRAFSLNRMAMNLGFSIGPALGGFISEYSFYLLFVINGVACFVAVIVFVLFFGRRKERNVSLNDDLTKEQKEAQKKRSPYTDYQFLFYTLFCAFFAISFFQLLNTLPLFLKEGVGLSKNGIGLVMGFSGLVIVLLEMPMVAIAEKRLTIMQIMFWGTLITGLSFFLYTIDKTLVTIYIAVTLMSIGEILVLPFMSTVTAFRSGPVNKGAYMGVNGISMGIGLVVSPYLGTIIASNFGFNILWTGTFALLVITAFGYRYTISKMPEVKPYV